MKKIILFISLFPYFLFMFFTSCDSKRVFEENIAISDAVWDIDEKITFEIEVKDTITSHNFYINVRNTGAYPYSNIFIFINSTFPDGGKARDTVECTLADASGRWLGDGSGDIFDNQILFKKGVRFPHSGKYIFEYEQAMRMEHLPFIMDVGMRIEKEIR